MLRHCGHRSLHISVYVGDVVDRGVVVDDGRVVHVVYDRGVDGGVGNVDPIHISFAHAV
jgi:hypothetical protein